MEYLRKNQRINIGIDVKYNMSREQSWLEGGTRNIGCSGMCLITRTSLLQDEDIHIRFRLPDTSRNIEVIGEVIWEEYVIEKDYFINEIKFTAIKPSDVDLISKYIDNATFVMGKRK
jgi:hypothetical protein